MKTNEQMPKWIRDQLLRAARPGRYGPVKVWAVEGAPETLGGLLLMTERETLPEGTHQTLSVLASGAILAEWALGPRKVSLTVGSKPIAVLGPVGRPTRHRQHVGCVATDLEREINIHGELDAFGTTPGPGRSHVGGVRNLFAWLEGARSWPAVAAARKSSALAIHALYEAGVAGALDNALWLS